MSITITPAYGRDYRSKKDALVDFNKGMDFSIASGRWAGAYCSKRDLCNEGTVTIRYLKLTRAVVVDPITGEVTS